MESYIYLTIKFAGVGYILYRIWNFIFRDRLPLLWDKIPVRQRKTGVVGKSVGVLLSNPRKGVPEPVATIDLEPTGFIGQEEPLTTSDDIETPEPPHIPSNEELYEDAPPPDPNEMSSGVAFEELSDAADVLVKDVPEDARRPKAAKTLYDVQNTEILDFITREVCSADVVERLLKECLDGDGFPLKKQQPIDGFDMGKYV